MEARGSCTVLGARCEVGWFFCSACLNFCLRPTGELYEGSLRPIGAVAGVGVWADEC